MSDELTLCLDHMTLSVGDLDAMAAFYETVLATLGLTCVGRMTAAQSGSVDFAGFGRGRKGSLWLAESGRQSPATHLCFRAETLDQVRAFHVAALAAGGLDNGEPGTREHYHPAYYAAFAIDPEGHNLEAVTFAGE